MGLINFRLLWLLESNIGLKCTIGYQTAPVSVHEYLLNGLELPHVVILKKRQVPFALSAHKQCRPIVKGLFNYRFTKIACTILVDVQGGRLFERKRALWIDTKQLTRLDSNWESYHNGNNVAGKCASIPCDGSWRRERIIRWSNCYNARHIHLFFDEILKDNQQSMDRLAS